MSVNCGVDGIFYARTENKKEVLSFEERCWTRLVPKLERLLLQAACITFAGMAQVARQIKSTPPLMNYVNIST
jgi:hypothetical protein